jgi:predicted DsbA family dithiol-disulfide isomerase
MILGDSRIRGRYVNNADVLAECAQEHGFEVTGLARRSIKATRRSFNQAIARAKYEHVMLFQRA